MVMKCNTNTTSDSEIFPNSMHSKCSQISCIQTFPKFHASKMFPNSMHHNFSQIPCFQNVPKFHASKLFPNLMYRKFSQTPRIKNFHELWFSGSLCSWHINLRGSFKAKTILVEEQYRYYLTHSWQG